MAAKYQLITELYQRTGAAVSRNPQAWQNFLSSACRNYKCRFDEQLLIFAQRPDATAVTTLETWNKQFKRWVNKDSRGIAVFDTKGRRNTLKYLFFIIGTMLGGLVGVVLMCLLQINRLSKREEVENAKTKCAGTVPLE